MNIRSSRVYTAPVPKMPPGLVELMEGLARDVLKNNPPEVYAFCADHMLKLLQIRDGSTTKKLPTLEQKIAIANKKIRDRAALRRNEFDKNLQLLQHAESDKIYTNEFDKENNTNAEQYMQQNIVKIPQNVLTGNIEHEIIAGLDEKKPLPLERTEVTDTANKSIIESSDTNPDDNCFSKTVSPNMTREDIPPTLERGIEQIENESSETEISTKNIYNNSSVEELSIINHDKTITSEEAPIDENVVKQLANFEEEKPDLNISNQDHIDESSILHVAGNTDKKIPNNILETDDADSTVSIENNMSHYTLQNVEIQEEIGKEEHKDYQNDHDITDVQNSLYNDNQKEDETNLDIDLKSNANNDNIIEETQEDEKLALFIDDNITGDPVNTENDIEEKNNQITESDHKNKLDESRGHIHNNSMDLETAAITIQKVFRSFLFRNKTLSVDDSTNIDMNLLIENKEKKEDEAVSNNNMNKDRRPLGVNRMDTVLQTVNEEKSLSLSTDDSSTLSSAATIIQAHVRGFLVRNNFNLNKTASSTSGIDSDGQSMTSLDGDNDYRKSKTVLNIHIIPEGGHFMSRDESMLTSMDLSLDGSPPGSTNLHPLGYDKSERRKQLKREDAIQSISPPSYNSGKLSDDVDSVKEILADGDSDNLKSESKVTSDESKILSDTKKVSTQSLNDDNISTMINTIKTEEFDTIKPDNSETKSNQLHSLSQMTSDEMDVVTPFVTSEEIVSPKLEDNNIKLMHSGECHDVVLPTKVSRNDTSVVRGE